MATAYGKIVAERYKHVGSCWFIWQPTGKVDPATNKPLDWYRWRLLTAEVIVQSTENTYPCIAGVSRGKCYAGAQTLTPDVTSSSPAWGSSTQTYHTQLVKRTSTDGAYLEFNKPANMTHCRFWYRGDTSGSGTSSFQFYNASGAIGTAITQNQHTASQGLYPLDWQAIPAGATKIRIANASGSALQITIAGVDWINKNSVVDPDTAGSMMMDAGGGDTQMVIQTDEWAPNLATNKSSHEIAIYWADAPAGTFAATKSIGGISHQGIGLVTATWTTQADEAEAAAWAPNQGDKLACDYLRVEMTGTAYQETVRTNARGSMSGVLLFDASGCIMEHTVTPSQDMNLFALYTLQCRPASGITKAWWYGDTKIRQYTAGHTLYACEDGADPTTSANLKTPGIMIWGGPMRTRYFLEHLSPDANHDCYRLVHGGLFIPRVDASGKMYCNYYYNETTPVTWASGSAKTTRFGLRLQDQGIMREGGSNWRTR